MSFFLVLARLDGINKPLRHSQTTMEDYLQLEDEPEVAEGKPGQKRVNSRLFMSLFPSLIVRKIIRRFLVWILPIILLRLKINDG